MHSKDWFDGGVSIAVCDDRLGSYWHCECGLRVINVFSAFWGSLNLIVRALVDLGRKDGFAQVRGARCCEV